MQPSGARSWVQRLIIRGRRRELGLGGFPLVSLAEAREKAFANRKLAREGGDPLTNRFRAEGMPTFAEAAERVWNDKSPGWRHSGHAQEWMSSLARHVLPDIGDKPVRDVTSADLLYTLRKIWHARPETARRVRQRISAVMEWAIAMHLRDDDPCDRLGKVLGPQQDLVQHMRALPHGEVAAAVAAVHASGATPAVKLAFEFLVLTAARSGEVRGAKWTRDRSAGPRMDHSGQAHEVAARSPRAALRARDGDSQGGAAAQRRLHSPLVFPSQGDKPISITRLPKILQSVKVDAVPHGFRSSFPRLGGRGDQLSAGGGRGGTGPRSRKPDRGGVRAVGSVRAAAAVDGRVGHVRRWRSRPGDLATPLTDGTFRRLNEWYTHGVASPLKPAAGGYTSGGRRAGTS